MIKVLYDYQAFAMQRYGGISRYFANLHEHLHNSEDVNTKLGIRYTKNQYAKEFQSAFTGLMHCLLSNHKMNKWNKRYSTSLIKQNDFDILHPTYYNPYFLEKLKKPFVITVHDMIHERFPQYFKADDEAIQFKRTIIQKANHIIAISESTKNDLQHFFGVVDDKISVVHHGFNPLPQNATYTPPFKNYILYVGDRRAYKNFSNFIIAAVAVLQNNSDIHIICTGGKTFTKEEMELLKKYGIERNVKQLNVSDAELAVLYKNALLLVFPSLYEGFGFPLLEAFQNNCAVACSNTSSFIEVGGDAVAYFDPKKTEEISKAINSIVYDRGYAARLKQKGIERLQKFTMQQCIFNTKEVYKKLI